jgi:hypothetical protein
METVPDAGHYGVPADDDTDDGYEADPDEGFRRVGLGCVPGLYFLKHRYGVFAKIPRFLENCRFFIKIAQL